MTPSDIVQKGWNYCNVLRDDGMSYGDYVEQLTFLLFLKMADERTKAPGRFFTNPPRCTPMAEVHLFREWWHIGCSGLRIGTVVRQAPA